MIAGIAICGGLLVSAVAVVSLALLCDRLVRHVVRQDLIGGTKGGDER